MSEPKQHISLFDKSYSESNASNYKLYAELSNDGFKHAIFTTDSNSFIGYEEYRFTDVYNNYSLVAPLKKIITDNPVYKATFKNISIAFVNNRSTLIPNAIFRPEKLADYHQFNFSKQEEDHFHSDKLINLSAHNIYSIPDYITNIFSSIKNISFNHFSSSLIEASLIQAKNEKTLSLINVHVLPSSFQVIAIKNQKLELYNSFIYQSSEDFIATRGSAELQARWAQRQSILEEALAENRRLSTEMLQYPVDSTERRILGYRVNALQETIDEITTFGSVSVGRRRPDQIELLLASDEAVVTDITFRVGDRWHNFKTIFYRDVVQEITRLQTYGIDMRSATQVRIFD